MKTTTGKDTPQPAPAQVPGEYRIAVCVDGSPEADAAFHTALQLKKPEHKRTHVAASVFSLS